ncbi:hypothetical protein ABTY98_13960 [Streptomyces sp. NPDC096040]|uniref:hypothetical protein n=1 Tax=Streptomyces sp. NPDC096040 TaxID=3155541 RepID=UPI00332B45C0
MSLSEFEPGPALLHRGRTLTAGGGRAGTPRSAARIGPGFGVTPSDRVAIPTQLLAEVTAGAIFHDGFRTLSPARAARLVRELMRLAC